MTNFEVVPLFPTPLYVARLEDELTQEEINFVERKEIYSLYEPIKNLSVGSDMFNVLDYPELQRIKSFIQYHLDNFAKTVMCIDNPLFPTISWLNRTTKDGRHPEHYHVNSVISGTFYMTDSPAPIQFHVDKNVVYGSLTFVPKNYNQFNTHTNIIEVQKGTLCLFPSYLKHSVSRTITAHDRISIAFNTWTSGTIGILDSTSYLNLNNPNLKNINSDDVNVVVERSKRNKQ